MISIGPTEKQSSVFSPLFISQISTTKRQGAIMRSLTVLLIVLVAFISANSEIKGICYSPFWGTQSPNGVAPTYAQEVKDLALLKSIMAKPRIRTFGIDTNYLRAIPVISESLSVAYTVYAWTSFSYSTTWAKARADLVKFLKLRDSLGYKNLEAIGYGYNNGLETYYSETEKVTKLITEIALTRVAAAPYKVKLTHEENWDLWCRHPELADSLDFVSVRIFPQDDLIKLHDAVSYVQKCYDTVKTFFPNKEVVVSSVGWSTQNSSETEQKIFLDSLVTKAKFDYFLFEFADETWKSGTEAKYGLLTSLRDQKLFLADSQHTAVFSDIFSADTMRVDGIVYNQASFSYPAGISVPALQKQIGFWADTLKEIAKYTFFYSADFGKADSQLIKIFSDNGNNVGILDGIKAESGVKMSFYAPPSINFKDSIGKQTYMDDIRHRNSEIRKKAASDSVFIGASFYGFCQGSYDSTLKYPETVSDFNGLVFNIDLYSYHSTKNIDRYIDSLFGIMQAKFPGKKFITVLSISSWNNLYYSGESRAAYAAFKKAKAKYGFAIVLNELSYFYVSLSVSPQVASDAYKAIMPWRFPQINAVISLAQQTPKASFIFTGQKFIIGDIKNDATLSIFDMQGRLAKQTSIKRNSSLDIKSAGFSAGNFLYRLRLNNKIVSGKFLLN